MPVSASTPSSVPVASAPPSWRAILAFCLGSTGRIRRYFARIESGATLVRDPFSAEQSRD